MQFFQNPFVYFLLYAKRDSQTINAIQCNAIRVKLLQNIEYQNSSINLEVSGL